MAKLKVISTGDKQNKQTKLKTKQKANEAKTLTEKRKRSKLNTQQRGGEYTRGRFRSYWTLCESKMFSSHLNAQNLFSSNGFVNISAS